MFYKDSKKISLIENLESIYDRISADYGVSPGDFPPLAMMQEKLKKYDFSKFPSLRQKMIDEVDRVMGNEIPKLMSMVPHEEKLEGDQVVTGGAFSATDDAPFTQNKALGADEGGETDWVVFEKKEQSYDNIFRSLKPKNGKLSGEQVKTEMTKSKLPNSVLARIWKLSDIDGDGYLDADEFAVAMYLIDFKLEGQDLPTALPPSVVPPSKREGDASGNPF